MSTGRMWKGWRVMCPGWRAKRGRACSRAIRDRGFRSIRSLFPCMTVHCWALSRKRRGQSLWTGTTDMSITAAGSAVLRMNLQRSNGRALRRWMCWRRYCRAMWWRGWPRGESGQRRWKTASFWRQFLKWRKIWIFGIIRCRPGWSMRQRRKSRMRTQRKRHRKILV